MAFLVLGLALFGLTGVLSGDAARRRAEADAGAALQALADRLALQLDTDMAIRFHQVEQLAALQVLFGGQMAPAAWRSMFQRIQQGEPYSWIGVAAPDGTVLAASGGLLEGQSVLQRPWFSRGRQGPLVSDVHDAVLLARLLPPDPSGEPLRFVDVAAPLRGADGVLRGVIGAHLGWRWAEDRRREALAQAQGRPGLDIVLVDRAGTIVLGAAQPGAPGLATPGVRLQRWTDAVRYLQASSPSRARGGDPGMGWTVVVRQPEASALAAADAVQQRVWALGALGAVLFGVLGWWLAGRLTLPLRRLAQQAQQVQQVQQAPQAPPAPQAAPGPTVLQPPAPGAGDEVAQLAAAIGQLLADLRAANETLEARVAQRTAALARANDDLRTFTRSVSHDLRGPLSGIAQLLRQVLDGNAVGDARARHALGLAAAEAERLQRLTDELLTLAMVEQRALQARPVDHAALVHEVLQGLLAAPGATAGAMPPALTVAPLPTLDGDPLLLRQVWTNLLANALKFSAHATPPRIAISAQDSGAEVEFCVADNGAGFDPSQADRLFRVFQRLHAARDYPGTGVGLSIVQRAVRRHGGRVRAESVPGQGARFCFTLPRHGAGLGPDDPPAGPAASPA